MAQTQWAFLRDYIRKAGGAGGACAELGSNKGMCNYDKISIPRESDDSDPFLFWLRETPTSQANRPRESYDSDSVFLVRDTATSEADWSRAL